MNPPSFLKFFFSIFTILILASASYGAVDTEALATATVAYYTFDENTGTTAFDSVGNNDGIISGATWTTGKINNGLDFGSTSNLRYVDMGNGLMPTSGDWTVSAWIYPTESSFGVIMSQGRPTTSQSFGFNTFTLAFGPTQNIRFDFNKDGTHTGNLYQHLSSGTLELNEWHYVTAVYSSSGDVKIYLNGQLDYNEDAVSGLELQTDIPFVVGARFRTNFEASFGGKIDEPVVFNRALTQEEVTYLFNSGSPTVNQQYPFSSNVETLEVDTLSLTNSLQDVNIKNIINEELDVLQINSNLQDITFKNVIKEELQPITFSLALQDVRFTTADILNLSPLQFNTSLQDITFKNIIKEDLDTLTFNQELQDVEIKNIIQLSLDPIAFNLGLNDVDFVSDVYIIKGIVTLKGSPIPNAIVRLINQTDNLYVEHFETGTDGKYEFKNLLSNKKYHTIVEYKDPQDNKYNVKSYPFLIPIKEEQ